MIGNEKRDVKDKKYEISNRVPMHNFITGFVNIIPWNVSAYNFIFGL
jgi:hypothetical protein